MDDTEQETIDWRKPVIADFIWDIFPHGLPLVEYRRFQDALGLLPSDDDGLDLLHREADKRQALMMPLRKKLDTLSPWAAEVIVEYVFRSAQFHGVDLSEIREHIRPQLVEQNAQVVHLAVTAVLGRLLEQGVLTYGEKL